MRFPVTAFGLRTPWAQGPEALFAAACGSSAVRPDPGLSGEAAFAQVLPGVTASTRRWGAKRVGAVVGAEAGDANPGWLAKLVGAAGMRGPSAFHVGSAAAGASAIAAGLRWISDGVVDAALVGARSVVGAQATEAWMLVERQGEAELCITAIAEADATAPGVAATMGADATAPGGDAWRVPSVTGPDSAEKGDLGSAVPLLCAVLGALSITSGRRPTGWATGHEAVETDRAICSFGSTRFALEVRAS